jgi:hypothetical protein
MEMYDESLKQKTNKITRIIESFESSSIKEHIKWFVAINAGALLWFFGNINSYCIDGKLFCKWWFIIGEGSLTFSLIVLYKIQVCIINSLTAFSNVKIDLLDKNVDYEKWLGNLNPLLKQFPSSKTALIGELSFLFGVVIMSICVFVFIILKK